jgi:hypothetical protein
MGRQALFYGTALIFTFLALAHATDGGKLLLAGRDTGVGIIKAFQGR